MEIKLGKADYLWAYGGYVFRYANMLLITPLILRYVPREEWGVWTLFFAIFSFVALLDAGISPIMSRAVTYAYSGAKQLCKEGLGEVAIGGGPNYALIAALLSSARKIYAAIAGLSFLALASGGTAYLWFVLQGQGREVLFWKMLPVWGLYITSTVLNIFYKYLNAALEGRGAVGLANKLGVFVGIVGVVLTFFALRAGWGLYGVAGVGFINLALSRILLSYYVFDSGTRQKLKEVPQEQRKQDLFPILWHNARKLALNSVGVFLIYHALTLVSGFFLTLEEVGSLGLALQAFGLVNVLSSSYFNMNAPRFASLYVVRKTDTLKREFLRSMLFSLCVYLCGIAGLLLLGPAILELWKSRTPLPATLVLALYGIVYFMEGIHGKCATFITLKNEVPFVRASLLTGAGCVTVAFILLSVTNLRLMALPIALICAHAVYNFWRWPLWVARDLRIRWRDFLPGNLR